MRLVIGAQCTHVTQFPKDPFSSLCLSFGLLRLMRPVSGREEHWGQETKWTPARPDVSASLRSGVAYLVASVDPSGMSAGVF